ncbi:hypothetical protein PF010_g32317 [Phytophthora fragariae]|uniref:PH domain-containing protein n=1 Tax=Phytophthora fragariae TaxID=53985 RepID=A0A6A3PR65_9STRA|nr:hypothetical protein PF003_g35611 [Phytophthora fragariae]KAE8954376.1 hypothetical protein PF011_g32119 [Phytophthora fragariae]KAE9054971.1 hypothetical protein PF010_g32317 [Phytophthora fragariae]KAE9056670.1 hypothetical protein PF006_g32615 [Phytophthora fragariae]
MTSGNLQIHFCGLVWLLTSVYIVRVTSKTCAAAKYSEASSSCLIVRRSRFAGGLLTIALDSTVRLIQCSTKDVEHNIIRLQYGRRGKLLVMRAANDVEHKEWITAITSSLSTFQAPKLQAPATSRQSFEVVRRSSVIAQARYSRALEADDVMPLRLSQSLDATKRLADGYDNLAAQWAQVATETRQFSADIASLEPPRIDPERCSTQLTSY